MNRLAFRLRPLLTRRFFSTPSALTHLSPEETALQSAARTFALKVVEPKVREMDENEKVDESIWKGLFEQGFMGLETSEEHGGVAANFMSAILVVEELARIDPAISVVCDVQNTLVNTLFRKYGTVAQKEKYLPMLAADTVGCFCLSEPAAGSDAFALQTRAHIKGDKYILEGSKMWITNSAEADIFLVFANVDPSKGYKGITCFIVEKKQGVHVAKHEKKLGIRASSTCTLSFDGIELDQSAVLGKVGDGYKYAIGILNEGRIGIAAQMIGCAQGAFDASLPYLYERKQFGQPIASFQGMQHQIAQLYTELEAARLLTYNAARLKGTSDDTAFAMQAAMAKLYSSQVAERVCSRAIEWMGGVGFTRDEKIEKFYRDCKIGAIYEGTSNIQLNTIAKFIEKEYKK